MPVLRLAMTRLPKAVNHHLPELASKMSRHTPSRHAWRDFVADYRHRLGVHSLKTAANVFVPEDMWAYWTAVAANESDDYDERGMRTQTWRPRWTDA
jgi:hypothetical protein